MGNKLTGFQPVQSLDLESYMGKWYEIIRLHPAPGAISFEGTAEKPYNYVTADYTLGDKNIKVVNTARNFQGQVKIAKGIAVTTEDPGILKVGFEPFTFIKGNYIILWLSPSDVNFRGFGQPTKYQLAIVGSKNRQHLWLLSRTKVTDEQQIEQLKTIFTTIGRNNGYSQDVLNRIYIVKQ